MSPTETGRVVRVLLLADTHLGFDLPTRPRVEKRRRGPDFFANTRLALQPALCGDVDLVVHGGDLLFRSKVPASLVSAALEPLLEVADTGVPVFLVPGNHERSALPYPLLAGHDNLHIFDVARTVPVERAGLRVAVSGFPCERDQIRSRFGELVDATGWRQETADIRLLCMHQTVEGARVENYTFRHGADVVPGRELPAGFAAVLCGHIHRMQVLDRDLAGRLLAAPVLYPGSIERTSSAERHEAKGFLTLEVEPGPPRGGVVSKWQFHELPTRPMRVVSVDAAGLAADTLSDAIRRELAALPVDSVVQLRVGGPLRAGAETVIRAAAIRELHPQTMTVDLRFRRFRE